MMLDITAVRQGFTYRKICDIGFLRSSCNIADGLTKSMRHISLQQTLENERVDTTAEQWIIRK